MDNEEDRTSHQPCDGRCPGPHDVTPGTDGHLENMAWLDLALGLQTGKADPETSILKLWYNIDICIEYILEKY